MKEYSLEEIIKAYNSSYDDVTSILFDEVLKDVPDKIHGVNNFKDYVKEGINLRTLPDLHRNHISLISAYFAITKQSTITFDNLKYIIVNTENTDFDTEYQNDPIIMAMTYIDKAVGIAVLRKLESM